MANDLLLADHILQLVFEQFVTEWEISCRRDFTPDWEGLSHFLHVCLAVCTQWRHVVLSSPRLWRNISDYDFLGYTSDIALPRSKAVPLHVWTDSVLETYTILYFISDSDRLNSVLSLHITLVKDWLDSDPLTMPLVLYPCPNVRTLSLRIWDEVDLQHVGAFVALFPRVSQLRLDRMELSHLAADNMVHTTHTGLRSMIIVQGICAHVETSLHSVRMPSLENLTIQLHRELTGGLPITFRVPDDSRFHSVRILTLGTVTGVQSWINIFQRTPFVHTLRLFDALAEDYLNDDLLQTLHPEKDGTVILPHLRTLALHLFPFTCDALANLLRSRNQAGAPQLSIMLSKDEPELYLKTSARIPIRVWTCAEEGLLGRTPG